MSASSSSTSLREICGLWLPLWLTVALASIFAHGPMPLYSTRTLAVAWEMWQQHEWLVPHINGAPYSHKVPLLFWMIHAGWAVFGVNDIWPRVLEVLIGGVQLLLAALLARRLFPERPWIARATPWMLMSLSYAFLFDLQIMYEVLLAVWVLAALLCLTPSSRRAAPRFVLFALCVGAGLLTKGPVMLLHVALVWLLGPLWNDWAQQHRAQWYGRGALALLGGCAILVAWALPAGFAGGEAYRHKLFFTQTAGRVVDSFDHARPWWWYLPRLPVLLFPFSLWPRAWTGLLGLRRPLAAGTRMLLCWLLPVFVVFCLVSGKQAYYPLPEFGGAVMLLAVGIARLRERGGRTAESTWLGSWPLAAASFGFGLLLLLLPKMVADGRLHAHWYVDLAVHSRAFAVVYLLLGVLLLVRGRGELRRICVAALLGAAAAHGLFTLSLWQDFDLRPAARYLSAAESHGRKIANLGVYEGQFHFLGRLKHPILRLRDGELASYAAAHPSALVVDYPHRLSRPILRYARLVQPFRSTWLVIWDARTLATLRAGGTPAEAARPTELYPPDYWRYRKLQ